MELARRDHAAILARHGGMVSGGQGLGVMIGTNVAACPRGWIFLKLGVATVDEIHGALVLVSEGRAPWP